MKLYRLNYVEKFHNKESNTDSLVTHSVHGIVGCNITPKYIHVDYDNSSSMAGMGFDVIGEFVSAEMIEES